jgi:uncharacterized membrane protein
MGRSPPLPEGLGNDGTVPTSSMCTIKLAIAEAAVKQSANEEATGLQYPNRKQALSGCRLVRVLVCVVAAEPGRPFLQAGLVGPSCLPRQARPLDPSSAQFGCQPTWQWAKSERKDDHAVS